MTCLTLKTCAKLIWVIPQVEKVQSRDDDKQYQTIDNQMDRIFRDSKKIPTNKFYVKGKSVSIVGKRLDSIKVPDLNSIRLFRRINNINL